MGRLFFFCRKRHFALMVFLSSLMTISASSSMFQSTNSIIQNMHPEIVLVRPPDPGHRAYKSYMKTLVDEDSVILRYAPKSLRKPGLEVVKYWEMSDTPRYLLTQEVDFIEAQVRYYFRHGRWSDRVILEKLYYALLFASTGDGPPMDVIDTTNAVPYDHVIMANTKYPSGFDLTEIQLSRANYHVPVPESYIIEAFQISEWHIGDETSDYCSWTGITCTDGEVSGISLPLLDLSGTLPVSMYQLVHLTQFNVFDNDLCGTVPKQYGYLRKLRHFNLAKNDFSGTLPSEFAALTRMRSFHIGSNKFEGEFPDFSSWRELQIFEIENNSFQGDIPPKAVVNNPRLMIFKISQNLFGGSLPRNPSNWRELSVFDASKNGLMGTIPETWLELPELIEFKVSQNSLSGKIPTEILLTSTLRVFDVSNNHLSGTLPRGDDVIPLVGMTHNGPPVGGMWSDLTNLVKFDIHNNGISGVLPPEMLYGLRLTLRSLDVGFNAFSGTIPKEIGRMIRLQHLGMNSNYFTGQLPSEMNHLSMTLMPNATDNLIVGSVPPIFCHPISDVLREFGCDAVLCPAGTFHPAGAATSQSGCRPCTVTYEGEMLDPPRSQILGRTQCDHVRFVEGDLNGDGVLSNREVLRLIYVNTVGKHWGEQFKSWSDMRVKSCDLSGVTCTGKHITKIDLTDAMLCSDGKLRMGPVEECRGIPAEISKLTSIEVLMFARKQFLYSSIPSEFGLLTRLKTLDFTGCASLHGRIPSEIGNLKILKVLSFSGCQFTGSIPPEVFELPRLEKFHLSLCPLTGSISTTLGQLSKIKELLISRNSLTGTLPTEIGKLTTLENLEIYGNGLSGRIPETLSRCTKLKRIDFFNNHLTGTIPPSLSKISTLQIVHLKTNRLTGTIPPGFGDLQLLSWFDISSNKIHGTIPSSFGATRSLKDFRVGDNMMYNPIPHSVCTNLVINDGVTRTHGCAGIACPLGTSSPSGHASYSEVCRKCPAGQTTMYLGSSKCQRMSEKDFLSIFFELMKGYKWDDEHKENWQDDAVDVCQWAGIDCGEDGEKISSIKFPLSTFYT